MNLVIKKAERLQKKAKIALIGPSGSGKTYTALRLAAGLAKGGSVLLLDTERSSATLYAGITSFDHADLPDYEYETFLAGIEAAKRGVYSVLVIDSLSHAWEAFLEMHEMESQRQKNSFTAWSKITPKYNALINAIVAYPGHCIVTMRAKTDYVMEENGKGKQAPKKVGLAPVMRPGSEYEFDVVGVIDIDHNLAIEKTRIDWLADKIVKKADEKLGEKIAEWLGSGAVAPQTQAAPTQPMPQQAPVAPVEDPIKTQTRAAMKENKTYQYDWSVFLAEIVRPEARAEMQERVKQANAIYEKETGRIHTLEPITTLGAYLVASPAIPETKTPEKQAEAQVINNAEVVATFGDDMPDFMNYPDAKKPEMTEAEARAKLQLLKAGKKVA